jgi:predicted transcriptional regulator
MSTKTNSGEGEVVRFRATQSLKTRLSKTAKRKGLKEQEIVRLALSEFLDRAESAAA